MAENLSKREEVNDDEEGWAKYRALGNTLCDCEGDSGVVMNRNEE